MENQKKLSFFRRRFSVFLTVEKVRMKRLFGKDVG